MCLLNNAGFEENLKSLFLGLVKKESVFCSKMKQILKFPSLSLLNEKITEDR